jgi:hypothetical protein
MQKGEHRSGSSGRDLCDLANGKGRCGNCPLDLGRDPVSEFRRCNRLDKGEVEYDWYITLASMWDDPTQDFDLNLEKQI